VDYINVKNYVLKQNVLEELHSSPTTGHSSFHKTYERDKFLFFWEGVKTTIQDFVVPYDTFQKNNVEMVKTPGNCNHYQFQHIYALTSLWIL
jgi:hypothetical protein